MGWTDGVRNAARNVEGRIRRYRMSKYVKLENLLGWIKDRKEQEWSSDRILEELVNWLVNRQVRDQGLRIEEARNEWYGKLGMWVGTLESDSMIQLIDGLFERQE